MPPNRTDSVRATLDAFLRPAVAVELGLILSLLVGFAIGTTALNAVLDPYFLDSDRSLLVIRSALVLAGIGALTASFAMWRGYAVGLSLPDRTDAGLVGVAVLSAVLLAVFSFVPLALRTGVSVGHVTATLSAVGGVFSLRTLVRVSLFVLGMVLLYHGLVQAAVERVFGHGNGLAVVVTTLLGGYLVAPTVAIYGTFAGGPWLSLWGSRGAVAALFVCCLGVAVYGDKRASDRRLAAVARLALLVTLALAVLVLAAAIDSPYDVLLTVTRAAVLGVAAYSYHRTRSLVAPTVVYASFAVVSSVLYVAAVTATLGS